MPDGVGSSIFFPGSSSIKNTDPDPKHFFFSKYVGLTLFYYYYNALMDKIADPDPVKPNPDRQSILIKL